MRRCSTAAICVVLAAGPYGCGTTTSHFERDTSSEDAHATDTELDTAHEPPPADGTGDVPADETPEGPCASTEPYCSADRRQVLACDPADGSVQVLATCLEGQACVGGACIAVVCFPGETGCVDGGTQQVCRDDGSGWDPVECGPGMGCRHGVCLEGCTIRIFVLMDGSRSMEEESRWAESRSALHDVLSDPANEDVEFGFGVFPTDDNCGVEGLVVHPAPEANATNVDEYFEESSPYGNTPLVFALSSFSEGSAGGMDDPSYHNAIVMLSDGEDVCYIDCVDRCGGMDPTCLMECAEERVAPTTTALAEATSALTATLGVRVFVIGLGSAVSEVQLDAIAENGGTTLGEWIPAYGAMGIAAGFDTILAEMRECI